MAVNVKTPSDNERTFSAIMHIAPILPLGIIVTILLLVTQGKTSAFLLRHGRQALAWQIVQMLLSMMAAAIYIPFYFQRFFQIIPWRTAATSKPDIAAFDQLFRMQMTFMSGTMCVLGIFFIVSAFQAIKALRGEAATYPLIGNLIERLVSSSKT